MKKNSKKVVLQKPKIGDLYKVFDDRGLDLNNLIRIVKVRGNFAHYTNYDNSPLEILNRWDFVTFPEILSQKLSPLEVELI